MMRLLTLVVAFVVASLHPVVTSANTQLVPKCLAGFCLDTRNLPTEKAVRERFGGSRQPFRWKAFAYCYRFTGPDQQVSYGHFIFKENLGSGWRLVTIRLSSESICSNAHAVHLRRPLSTREGIQLNTNDGEVLKSYGQPRYALRPPPTEVVRDFFGDIQNTKVDVIDQYVSSDGRDPSTALFHISNGRVVGIEVSVDE